MIITAFTVIPTNSKVSISAIAINQGRSYFAKRTRNALSGFQLHGSCQEAV